jgi:hypothetical protein
MVYDFFLENKHISSAKFTTLYIKAIFKRLYSLSSGLLPVIRSFTIDKREGDLAAFDAMRSLVFLKRLLTSYGEAKGYFNQIKKVQASIQSQSPTPKFITA